MSDDYQIQHRAPGDDGYSHPIAEARQAFGPDILEAPDLYGSSDEQTMTQLRAALEGADTVRIYRAVPQGVTAINDGDWVTLSREYAHDHGWNEDPAQVMPVVAADVPVTSVYTDGNDPRDGGWQEVIRRADHLLIPVSWEPDVMRSATAMIDDLRHDLSVPEIRQKVILVHTRPPFRRPSGRRAREYEASLTQAGLRVETLPPDRHLDQHGRIEWAKLASRTRAAATHIAEEVIAS